MNSLPFTIKIRVGDKEIELSGSKEDVLEMLNNLPDVVDKVTHAFTITPVKGMEEKNQSTSKEGYPSVSVASDTPCPEVILNLLSTEWGRKKPRRLSELLEAMKVNAIHFPIGTVKGRLTDLTKKGALRRVREGREYGYIRVK